MSSHSSLRIEIQTHKKKTKNKQNGKKKNFSLIVSFHFISFLMENGLQQGNELKFSLA